jgi:hypothetical protein
MVLSDMFGEQGKNQVALTPYESNFGASAFTAVMKLVSVFWL